MMVKRLFECWMALVMLLLCVCRGGELPWRGLHVDVSRHFFEPAVLQQVMNRMAELNFNRLHLHLTDGPGWRLEIKRYPRLTSVGAWRKKLPDGPWD